MPKPARYKRALPGPGAFTIIELLIVMSIILVLAGLILGTSSYVQKKGARSRAEAELAAISAALESYKADNGVYPSDPATTAKLDPTKVNSYEYRAASQFLYGELSGDRDFDGSPDTSNSSLRIYLHLTSGQILRDDMSKAASRGNPAVGIRDPFGSPYGYSTAKASDLASPFGYNPTFDLWSTSGPQDDKETDDQYRLRWVKNW